ncbi:MAG: helicase-related protein [Candidatus Babeliales bacterium]|jgi:hypothetical protein
MLLDAIRQDGWEKVVLFNGETKDGLKQFVEGDADILIASSCIGTGINKLQNVCSRIIINCLPWTSAEYRQLFGRIYRPGQKEKFIDVIIPLTFAEINGVRWSWCETRWKRIEFKKGIADAAVDGIIPEGQLRSFAQAYNDCMKWLDQAKQGIVYEIERSKNMSVLSSDIEQVALRRISNFTRMNQRINAQTSEQTHQRFMENPQDLHKYHEAYREVRKKWEVIPYEEAVRWITKRPHWTVGDFGCGEALLAQKVINKIYSFDHIAINDNVIPCDISNVPLSGATLDAAVFSLSLMGTNYVDYLKEANRCLKLDGHLWIAEPTSRIVDINQFKDLLYRLGFDIRSTEQKGDFTIIVAMKSSRKMNDAMLDSMNYKEILN